MHSLWASRGGQTAPGKKTEGPEAHESNEALRKPYGMLGVKHDRI
jgi:hypothetical protein